MEILYKRAKTGKIVSYRIFVENQLSDNNPHPVIVKETGQLDGKKTYHREPVPAGKQKRTALEQAEAQALSDWSRKRDEGYKSLIDLNILELEPAGKIHHNTDYRYDYSGGTFYGTLQQCLDKALLEFNTDAAGNVKPMLAKAVDWKKVTYPCLVQPKLDGVRCLMVFTSDTSKSGAVFKTIMLSRNGKEYATLNHIKIDVGNARMDGRITESFILDGEIYSDELTFQQIIAAVKKQRDDSLKLKFRAYDIVNDKIQSERWTDTVALVDAIASPEVWPVPTIVAQSQQDIKNWHDRYVQEGNEGAMIRLYDGKYGQGQRSSSLLKVKEFMEDEFAFKNFEFGQRGAEDLIAVCWDGTGEKKFRAKMIGTKAEKEELYELNDTLEGKSITIKHFGFTTDGLPRFPIGKGFRNYD